MLDYGILYERNISPPKNQDCYGTLGIIITVSNELVVAEILLLH
jgi:hypothetical protein